MEDLEERRQQVIDSTVDIEKRSAYETVGRESMLDLRIDPDDVLPAALDLPRLSLSRPPDAVAGADFEVTELLGEGGMGQVELARQLALGRDVAVKHLLGADHSPREVETLLREARLTGRLEHPNIIPVHWIGYCEGVGPVVVMKRVRGRTWSEALDELDREDEGALDGHIETLLRVCDAVDYAHSMGVIHRDLKPANVMIGDFGEVYVLDWGIAVELHRWEPDTCKVTGTPGYIAPEMVDPGHAAIGRRSDVYLLGATLYEILFGEPPHGRGRAIDALMAALGPVEMPEDRRVPEMLVDVCRRACAVDPEERYASVADLRQALRDYFQRRNAIQLATAAEQQLDAALRAMEVAGGDTAAILERLDAAKHQFQNALDLWGDNPVARDGLSRVVEPAVACHLALGNLPAARRLVDRSADDVHPELIAHLEALERERSLDERARQHVEEQRRQRSLRLGGKTRSRVILGGVVGYLVPVVAISLLRPGGELTEPWTMFGVVSAILVAWLVILAVMRKRMVATFVDRTATLACTVALVLVFANRALGALAGYPSRTIVQVDLLLAAGPFLVLATLHRRFYGLGAVLIAGSAAMIAYPPASRLLINVLPAVVVLAMFDLWRRLGADVDRPSVASFLSRPPRDP